ncbi:SDR family NAD(P)-dependent oxidoreductase [Rhodococcus sp. ACS1]|uniref:SDR family NAD(P)-dependent oxidoreductase n=1 Tax=Rhodococcus sp. ACS1 TaxID=2028570 RepID=UPI00211B9111|nr:SDR family NAD(P)-dependent oxidoreductase [Rhodococcus sp. ACS1]
MELPHFADTNTDLTGLTAVVTGGNGGIGLGLASGLAHAGANVCIWGRSEEKNASAVGQLRDAAGKAHAISCDVSDEADVDRAMTETLAAFGRVDSLFANAGVPGDMTPFVDLSLDDWRRTLAINLEGAFLSLRAAARHMVERGEGGSLVGVSSIMSFYGGAQKQPYAVSKAGIEALMRSLAVELAANRIRANALLPGWTDTALLEPGAGFIADEHHALIRKQTIGRTPVRRWGQPADFARIAVFLADPTLQFHTGDRLVVDGAYTRF